MNWLEKASQAHVKFATLFERIGKLAEAVQELSHDLRDANQRIARLEGAAIHSGNMELMRQVADLQQRLSAVEVRMNLEGKIADSESSDMKYLTSKNRV